MNDTTLSPAERIRTFADAVRAELADLPEEEIDDLIGGLIGDLTDQAQDAGGEITLGDPVAYAQELRDAAGLPARTTDAEDFPSAGERLAAWWTRTITSIRSTAFGTWLIDLLLSLRPVWWVLRGVGLYAVWRVLPTFVTGRQVDLWPADTLSVLVLLGLILLSVQWGRGKWLPKQWMRHLRTAITIIALIALPMMLSGINDRVSAYNDYTESDEASYNPSGLRLDGLQITNLFAYDVAGNPIEGVQIFTEKGTPLNLYGQESQYSDYGWGENGEGEVTVPWRDAQDNKIWNVYPLQTGPVPMEEPADWSLVHPAEAPFRLAPDLEALIPASDDATGDPEPTASPTPAPEPTP